jgi:hypothetical protein
MNRFQKIFSGAVITALKLAEKIPFVGVKFVEASFEAVRQNWGERSYLWQALQEAWQEIDSMTRQELQRIHQNLVENTPIVQKLKSLFLQFSVGSCGLTVTPNASRMDDNPNKTPAQRKAEKTLVENWNLLRGESWERWWRRPFLNSDLTGAQGTIEWGNSLFDRGAILVNLILVQDKGLNRVTPKIETIDPIRLKTPSGETEYKGNPIIDGVEIDLVTGARLAGWILKSDYTATVGLVRNAAEQFTRIEFYQPGMKGGLVHKFRPRFLGQIRELPEGFAAYNILRDLNNLFQLEMNCAKLAGEIATVEYNQSGELSTRTNRQVGIKITTQNAAGATVNKQAFIDRTVSFGGKKIAMMNGDDLKNFMITRPSVAQQEHWDTLWTNVCMAYEQPKLLVMPYSLQGTVTRADLDVCANSYRFKFEIVKDVLQTVYEWKTQWDADYNTRDFPQDHLPQDYLASFIRPPRSPNVDIGYTAKALEIEVRLGVKTLPDVYAEKQQDWRQKLREIAETINYVNELADEYDVDAGQITSLAIEQAVTDPKTDGEHGSEEDSAEAQHSHKIRA